MYTIKCPFCPEYFNNSKPHSCNGTLAHIQKQAAESLSQSLNEARASGWEMKPMTPFTNEEFIDALSQIPNKQSAELPKSLSQFTTLEPREELETTAKPTRYNQGELEYWDAVNKLGWGYMQGTAGKYLHRYKDKNGPEDLVKAINYIVKMISQETGTDYYELHKLSPEELAKRIKK